jgi:predicted acylesterase/phospholipase RssA
VVCGVSTGALIAPFAFLGPEYDAALERGYTTTTAADLYSLRVPPAQLWSDSLAKAHPLRQRVKAEITPELLQRVARAHAEGRRLYVGTTDLDTKRLVVWDLGAIAAGNEPRKLKLFRDVILASCAVPGLLPPVQIDIEVDGQRRTELHVDGGVSASLFLPPSVLGVRPGEEGPPAAGTNVYVIVAGKLKMGSKPVERRFTRVSGESLSALFQSRTEGDLLRVYMQARRAGAEFRLTAVPDDLPVDSDWMALDVAALKRVFEAGHQCGVSGTAWRPAPPGLEPGDQSPPRAGVRFVVAE